MIGPLLAPMAFFAATSLVCLDDGNMHGEGGTAELVSGSHPSIRMESEVVRIDQLPKGRVHAKFIFKNRGKATDVLIGFPGMAFGEGGGGSALGNFKSWVDGKRVNVKILLAKHKGIEDDDFHRWYTKRVHFDAGQTRVIEDRYTGGGGVMAGGYKRYGYVLRTGASWHGTIGKATIIVDSSGLANYAPLLFLPKGAEIRGTTAKWTRTDLKPEATDDITIHWFPAFRQVYVNGVAPAQGRTNARHPDVFNIGNCSSTDLAHCQLVGHSVRLPAKLATSWLGGSLKTLGRNRYRLVLGQRWAEFTIGSSTVVGSNGTKTQMEFPARRVVVDQYSGNETFPVVGFASLVKALGGKATLNMTKRRLDIWIK